MDDIIAAVRKVERHCAARGWAARARRAA
jgi:hypothetical protein